MLALLDDLPERARLREAAHAFVLANYRWSAVARRWRRLIDSHREDDHNDPDASS